MSQLFDEATQFVDETTGELLEGGFIYIGENGLDAKLNPVTIYPDRELQGTPLANPQTIGSDGRSENKIWISGKHSFKVESSANVQKYNELENGFDEAVGNTVLINALGVNDIVVNGSPTVTALVDSQTYIFTAPADNTGAMTLTIDSTATLPIKIHHDQALASGDVKSSQKVVVVYNLADGIYEVQTDLSGVTLNGTEILTNKTLTAPVITDLTINGITTYGVVILDTPEILKGGTGETVNAWVSSSLFSSTTLSTAGAVRAIIRITSELTRTSTTVASAIYIRKAGTALGITDASIIARAEKEVSASAAIAVTAVGEGIVNLDVNSDFEYYLFGLSASTNTDIGVALVGYYV